MLTKTTKLPLVDPLIRAYTDAHCSKAYLDSPRWGYSIVSRHTLDTIYMDLNDSLLFDSWIHDCWKNDEQVLGINPQAFSRTIRKAQKVCQNYLNNYPEIGVFYFTPRPVNVGA